MQFIFSAKQVSAQIITTYGGNGIAAYSGDGGLATNAALNNPIGLSIDGSGNLYIAEFFSHRIRKINASTGIITTIAGNGTPGFSGDGGLAINAQLNNPSGVYTDDVGNVYITDDQNFRVRKVNASTGIITTIAGGGATNYISGAIAVNTRIGYCGGITGDASGNLYISQAAPNIVCKINLASGIITTIAGNGLQGYSGDGGPATNASLYFPAGLCVDIAGNLYIAEILNNCIRKITAATGIISTIAGTGNAGFSGEGGPAMNAGLNGPSGVYSDVSGNLFIADRYNSRVRKIVSGAGVINTIAGNGVYGYGGDGGSAISSCAMLSDPHKVVVDNAGNVYFTDQSNSRIRKIDYQNVGTGNPSIVISASIADICVSTTVTFTASATTGGVFQWSKNGMNVGTNANTYTGQFTTGDVIVCKLSVSLGCGGNPVMYTSNSITMQGTNDVIPEVTVAASNLEICSGSTVTFTATNKSGNLSPTYQWIVNSNNVGTNNPVYTTNSLTNGSVVECRMAVPQCGGGGTKDFSDPITITVKPFLNPSITISTNNSSVCKGGQVSFTATALQSGTQPNYQWKVNGNNAGTNGPDFQTSLLKDGDVVSCDLQLNAAEKCFLNSSVSSNIIRITVTEPSNSSISIISSTNNICPASIVEFTATTQNAGPSASFQWQVNGNNVGDNKPVYSNAVSNGDIVSCLLAGNSGCSATTVRSNIIIMDVKEQPAISIFPTDTIVSPGTQLAITVMVSGNISSYEWTPSGLLINPQSLNVVTVPLQTASNYTLRVISTDGCEATGSTNIKLMTKFYMPNAFTPNNDGVNDIFVIPQGTQLKLKEFFIYDRWGNKIFYTNNISQGWNGKYNDRILSTNSFVYTISGINEGKKFFTSGTVLLLR
jgi:gliding motility-associated-like protein